MTLPKLKIECFKCGKEKLSKEFYRDRNEYKSCNDCHNRAQRLIDVEFKNAFELLNGLL